jgi:hypothetical protein
LRSEVERCKEVGLETNDNFNLRYPTTQELVISASFIKANLVQEERSIEIRQP